ncbi:hypothetical protein Dform_00736 [Dehalogenimonas formicexedens]|uniref:Uncharacterized protein n=1 Tax=Dehalogenimonas formicexedens TaxID=1839801 RepID=A0A1P8F6I2_9CHLR|nr:hypothetical protein [Dehalogenimonas formicexedens]APV44091.1 hypothetical protein Dform_00736 [Dehalogenimonas formicexedens]
MGEIRSAKEIAAERLKDIGEITEEDRLRWKFVPAGEKLGQRYMSERLDIEGELATFDDKQLPFVKQGMTQSLLIYLDLPRNETIETRNYKVMEGLMQIKEDKQSAATALGQLQRVFEHYAQQGEAQRAQAKQTLKNKFEQSLKQALRAQGKAYPDQVNVEQFPQFEEEWRRTLAQMEQQYVKSLDEIKKHLAQIQ